MSVGGGGNASEAAGDPRAARAGGAGGSRSTTYTRTPAALSKSSQSSQLRNDDDLSSPPLLPGVLTTGFRGDGVSMLLDEYGCTSFRFVSLDLMPGAPSMTGTSFWGFRTNTPIQWRPTHLVWSNNHLHRWVI